MLKTRYTSGSRHETRKAKALARRSEVMAKAKIHPTKGHPINRLSAVDRWALSQEAKEKNLI